MCRRCELWKVICELWTMTCELRIVNCELLTVHWKCNMQLWHIKYSSMINVETDAVLFLKSFAVPETFSCFGDVQLFPSGSALPELVLTFSSILRNSVVPEMLSCYWVVHLLLSLRCSPATEMLSCYRDAQLLLRCSPVTEMFDCYIDVWPLLICWAVTA